ncbi:hypothetical protein MA788_003971 [Vibrio parahaemolyticus]|nr:hypothetical protein [Vibrio parahaemolyticus]
MDAVKTFLFELYKGFDLKYQTPNWPSIKMLGQSNAVKLTMIIPFVGYLILFNGHVVSLINSVFEMASISEEEVNYISNLYFIYFGLTALGIATLMFQLLCPPLIKEYTSVRAYVESNIDFMTEHRLKSLCNHIDNTNNEKHFVIENARKSLDKELASTKESLRDASIDVLQHFWNLSSWSKVGTRLCIVLLYVGGFILLTIPSIKMFTKVLSAFF